MDNETYCRCLSHLDAADQCMDERADAVHRAHLSLVIERLKEVYEPLPSTPFPARKQVH